MFELNYNLILELCKCSAIISDKDSRLNFICNNNKLYIFVCDYKSNVIVETNTEHQDFSFGISLTKFLSVSKKFYQSDVKFKLGKSSLQISQGNMKVRLPLAICDEFPIISTDFISFATEQMPWIVRSIIDCNNSVSDMGQFKGVLIDYTNDPVKVCKFSSSIITIVTSCEFVNNFNKRFVVSSEIINVIKSLAKNISNLKVSDNMFSVEFKSGVRVISSLYFDNFPKEYIQALGLSNNVDLIDTNDFKQYKFNRDELFTAIDTVITVSDQNKAFVGLETIGFEDQTGLTIWKVYTKTNDGTYAEELFRCDSVKSNNNWTKFIISGKDLMNTLKTKGEHIYVYNSDDGFIIISDKEHTGVTMLIKAVSL